MKVGGGGVIWIAVLGYEPAVDSLATALIHKFWSKVYWSDGSFPILAAMKGGGFKSIMNNLLQKIFKNSFHFFDEDSKLGWKILFITCFCKV